VANERGRVLERMADYAFAIPPYELTNPSGFKAADNILIYFDVELHIVEKHKHRF